METYDLASNFAQQTNRSLFLTGKAGTGKTTFLRNLKKTSNKQIAVVAPTGVAAINAGGTTIHSFFQLPFTPFFPTPEGRKDLIGKIKMQEHRRRVLRELEVLVIDEISMVRADLLDSIDCLLQYFRYRNNEPFGGVQVIFIGDMFQLSPVATDEEWKLLSQYYTSPYFFNSQVVTQQPPLYIEFEKIYRQTNYEFIRVLNEIRNDCLTPESLQLLEQRYHPGFVPPANDSYITLTTHNYKADRINAEELAKIKGKTFRFEAAIQGDYPEKSYPTEKILELKIGAKVMFLKNDTEQPRRFYNGKIGVVEGVDEKVIIIKCPDDEETIELSQAIWENIRYRANPTTKKIEEDNLGNFTQYPLRLAWAITIHKSQGLTFDKAVIDAGEAFAAGQVYVALSRCRSLEGMVLLSKIRPSTIHSNRHIVDYERNKVPTDVLLTELDTSRRMFRGFLLQSFFIFSSITGNAKRLLSEIKTAGDSFNEDTVPFVHDIVQQLEIIDEVAMKFSQQLNTITSSNPVDEMFLQNRLSAASGFFEEKINILLDTLWQSPASTDSRGNATEYNEAIKEIWGDLALKNHILSGLSKDSDVNRFFELRNSFVQPPFSLNAYAKAASTKEKLAHPKLYYLLVNERNKICEPQNLPIYIVASSKTLFEMSEYLPHTKNELMEISGFGAAKIEKFGQSFLDIIHAYCEKNNLTSRMEKKEKKRKKKNRKEKKQKEEKLKNSPPKSETYHITLGMYKSGKSIEQIAEERSLVTSTIASHLSRFIQSGNLLFSDFISPEQFARAEALLKNAPKEASPFHILKEHFSIIETTIILGRIRGKS